MSTIEAKQALRELNQDLNLQYEEQDWGIVNSNGARLEEFIRYFENHPGLVSTAQFELGDLILASANEVLTEDASAALPLLKPFLESQAETFVVHMDYWMGLEGRDEFPLGHWLRENMKTKSVTRTDP